MLLLKLRALVADKELVVARANMETQRYGEWSMDHQTIAAAIQADIEAVLRQIDEES